MYIFRNNKSFKLNQIYDIKNNSFNDLRFIMAALVIYVHAYVFYYGFGQQQVDILTSISNNQISFGTFAVYGFFIISGFFMIQSLERTNLKNYIKNRFYRIIPAFWVSLFISAFILAPLISSENVFYPLSGSAIEFFFKSAFFHLFGYSWEINGVFSTNPFPNAINGSMWTLKHEIACYLLLPFSMYVAHNSRKILLFITIGLFILAVSNLQASFLLFKMNTHYWVLSTAEYSSFIVLSTYFFIGACIYSFRDYIVVSKRLIILGIIFCLMGIFFGNIKLIFLVILPYLIVSFGVLIKKSFSSNFGDYSYGLYIYAFPIQQTIIHFYADKLNFIFFVILSYVITILLSILSWHYIENPILKLKKKK